ncbi:unnamed protein product, partial [Ectocarpus sp. 13 AM-2016]
LRAGEAVVRQLCRAGRANHLHVFLVSPPAALGWAAGDLFVDHLRRLVRDLDLAALLGLGGGLRGPLQPLVLHLLLLQDLDASVARGRRCCSCSRACSCSCSCCRRWRVLHIGREVDDGFVVVINVHGRCRRRGALGCPPCHDSSCRRIAFRKTRTPPLYHTFSIKDCCCGSAATRVEGEIGWSQVLSGVTP